MAALLDSYLQRQKFLARLQAVEVGKLLAGDGSGKATATQPAGFSTPDALLDRMGVTL